MIVGHEKGALNLLLDYFNNVRLRYNQNRILVDFAAKLQTSKRTANRKDSNKKHKMMIRRRWKMAMAKTTMTTTTTAMVIDLADDF